jgi:hypothetical protein
MTRRHFVAIGLALAGSPRDRAVRAAQLPVAAVAGRTAAVPQPSYANGVFVGTPGGPVELIAYADRIGNGQLRMSYGTFEDVPAIESIQRLLCNLPNWKPVLVWVSTRRIFRDEYAERRELRFAVRPLSLVALEVRVADLENAERLRRLTASVGATAGNPAYLFITMSTGSIAREYMVEIKLD